MGRPAVGVGVVEYPGIVGGGVDGGVGVGVAGHGCRGGGVGVGCRAVGLGEEGDWGDHSLGAMPGVGRCR